MWDFPLFPERASTAADQVDMLYLALCLFSGVISVIVIGLLMFFAIRYRSGATVNRKIRSHSGMKLEIIWIITLTVIGVFFFAWSSFLYYRHTRPPDETIDIYVVGKQWMWKLQHPGGQREINELHVPVGRPVKLIMTSQDVIHSFYIPAFRLKMDVLPGRYHTLWFTATKPGTYHLFCAEYCGAEHSHMVGRVVVMEDADYQKWLEPGADEPLTGLPATQQGGMITRGTGPFFQFGCNACHIPNADIRAPRLEGLFGRQVKLQNNQTVVADEQYLRESILRPNAKIVAGYPSPSLMPPYEGQINEQQLAQLIEYIKRLSPEDAAQSAPATQDQPQPQEGSSP